MIVMVVRMIPTGWSRIGDDIKRKFGKEPWYGDVHAYLIQRYNSIENRMIETFRYVACHPDNRNTFSYEYASMLRDAGSVFGSVMDRLVRETSPDSGLLDIRDYTRWLRQLDIEFSRGKFAKIHFIAADINYPLKKRALFPYLPLKDEDGRLEWWNAYNDVKHSDIDKFHVGNFENSLNSVAALAILLALFGEEESYSIRLFYQIGFYLFNRPPTPEWEEYQLSLLFFKT